MHRSVPLCTIQFAVGFLISSGWGGGWGSRWGRSEGAELEGKNKRGGAG